MSASQHLQRLLLTVALTALSLTAAAPAAGAGPAGASQDQRAAMAGDAAGNWVGSWSASPQPVWGPDFIFPTNIPVSVERRTIRQVVRLSLGGDKVRVELSNTYGAEPLHIGEARVALASAKAESQGQTVPGTDRPLRFGGQPEITIPPGAAVLSDAVELPVPPLASLAVSLFLPGPARLETFHWEGRRTAYIAAGNATASTHLAEPAITPARIVLSHILVDAAAPARAVVALGDSITDGAGATPETDRRWPDFLAQRLAPANVAVLNAGISGARVLRDRMGVNALARFERDVLAQPGVAAVILLMGINDISWPGTLFAPEEPAMQAQALIAGYRQLIARAHSRGVRIVGATLPPFEGALEGTPLDNYYNTDKEALRQQVNAWIRTSGAFDAVVDFDALLRDPAHPARLLPAYDSGDHLHPGDRGYRAMAEAIDLEALL
ncbi:SGNH/GDSL hydrolase family protein [Cupriavidus basilensis]|uniref:SGNH/GDSL hydrolase family protein n=1 Tax=Cupriavidus basilensis TaxID=68895 RepID=A0ABT6AY04_9BURK|nr:SGNH/GDSL hydrolase family protein [Cupriavidus basilensis]MDF3837369.1 SGNH/GDSL hydrolase family protein [Cupriavidus basilensis]